MTYSEGCKFVPYRDILLMKGSESYALYFDKEDKGHKKLDRLLKELDQKNKDLLQRYD
jgi:hypothetical protein